MAGKTRAPIGTQRVADQSRALSKNNEKPLFYPSGAPFSGLQQTIGNQAMLQLLESGVLQAKLRMSQPGDADEIEADRVADRIVSRQQAPALQQKCSCAGGTSCPKCAAEEEETIHRSVAAPSLRLSEISIQRAPAPTESQATNAKAEQPPGRVPHHPPLIVDDETPSLAPGQMKKSQFVAQLRKEVCATADAALAQAGRSSNSCPYIELWLGFYAAQSGDHIERALHKYAPETVRARRAQDYFSIVNNRVRHAITIWAKTGKITGVPPGVALAPTAQGSREQKSPISQSPMAKGAVAKKSAASPPNQSPRNESVLAKRKDGAAAAHPNAASVRQQLGPGRALDSGVRSRMESTFGQDFSHVHLHTDSNAANLSTELNARAFTVGKDVAFATGEYQPGTPVGDALIAHELAHVVQQGGSQPSAAPMLKGGADYGALETDADVSAVGAVAALWAGAKGRLSDIGRNAGPRLKSGLKLQRCGKTSSSGPAAAHYYDEPSGAVEGVLHWAGLRPTKADRVREARQFFAVSPGLVIDGEEVDADELSDDEVMEKFRQYKEACLQMTMGGQIPCERIIPTAAGVGPSPPAGWPGTPNEFGKEIEWPGQGKIKTPAEEVDLAKLRRAGVTEKWATEQAKIYRDVAKANPRNPSATLRAEWLEKIAERLRNEP